MQIEKEKDHIYRYWRIHIMIGMYVGYAGFYLTRKSFNYVVPTLITDLGIDKNTQISLLFFV